MAEEHGFQAPEGHNLCRNNCGFFGSPATQNLCSKCYRDFCLKEEQAKSGESALENSMFASSSSEVPLVIIPSSPAAPSPGVSDKGQASVPPQPAAQPNRCSLCRKRVGLTGFRCRCGMTCCGAHRYPEQHGCAFDFKAMGREAIAKANPVVKGEKLEKI